MLFRSHVREIRNPTVNYPKAVFLGALITVAIFIFGTYALGLIIPAKDINLVQSLLVGFDNYFRYFHIGWLSPVIAVALVFGVLAGVLTWVAGPSKGILAVGKAGYLPPPFDISIQPFEDCCTIFAPDRPKTNPKIKNVERYEGRMDVESLVERAVAGIMVTEITPIEEAQDEVDTLIEDLL